MITASDILTTMHPRGTEHVLVKTGFGIVFESIDREGAEGRLRREHRAWLIERLYGDVRRQAAKAYAELEGLYQLPKDELEHIHKLLIPLMHAGEDIQNDTQQTTTQ